MEHYFYTMRTLLLVAVCFMVSCKQESGQKESISNLDEPSHYVQAPLEIYDFEGLRPFLKTNTDKIYMDSNTWIPAINPDWSGAIPATLIFNKNKRQFYEQTFTYEELETELKQFLE